MSRDQNFNRSKTLIPQNFIAQRDSKAVSQQPNVLGNDAIK